eukprot:5722831-Prymnesium_polylepis.1
MKAIPSTVSSIECVTRIDCCASGARTARASSARSAACDTRARGGVRCSGHTALAAATRLTRLTRVHTGEERREAVARGPVLATTARCAPARCNAVSHVLHLCPKYVARPTPMPQIWRHVLQLWRHVLQLWRHVLQLWRHILQLWPHLLQLRVGRGKARQEEVEVGRREELPRP